MKKIDEQDRPAGRELDERRYRGQLSDRKPDFSLYPFQSGFHSAPRRNERRS